MKRSDMDMIAQDMVCVAERADGKGKVEGYYFCLHHNDGRTHLHHLIIPLEADLSRGTPLDQIQVEVVSESITLKAQEPVKPIIKHEMDDVCSCIDNVAYCGKCGELIGRLKQNYCSNCGRKVKWE